MDIKWRVYLNLPETFAALKITETYNLFLNLYEAAKHGLAVIVMPVFIPSNLGLRNNLFVFYQYIYFLDPFSWIIVDL